MENRLQRTSLSQQVADQLESTFRSQQIAEGSKIPSEAQLAQQFGVSRTVIREALKYLQARGLVAIQQGKGTTYLGYDASKSEYQLFKNRYTEPDSIELDQAFHIGAVVFASTVKLALLKHTEKDLQKLRSITMKMSSAKDTKELNELYFKFTQKIAAIGENQLNIRLTQTISDYFLVANEILLTAYEDTQFMVDYAQAVIEGLEEGNEEKILAADKQLQAINRAMLNLLIREHSQSS